MSKNIITKIEGSKIWGYVAIASGIAMVGALVITAKEVYEARKASETLAEVEKDLEEIATDEAVEAFMGEELLETGVHQTEFASSYRPLRQTWTEE